MDIGNVEKCLSRKYHSKAFKAVEFITINIVLALVALIIFAVDPSKQAIFPACYIYSSTGIYCPGCGMTRALHSLLHGDFILASKFNIMILVLILVGVFIYISYFAWRFFNYNIIDKIKIKPIYLYAFLILYILFFVLRNIPFPPFNFFAP